MPFEISLFVHFVMIIMTHPEQRIAVWTKKKPFASSYASTNLRFIDCVRSSCTHLVEIHAFDSWLIRCAHPESPFHVATSSLSSPRIFLPHSKISDAPRFASLLSSILPSVGRMIDSFAAPLAIDLAAFDCDHCLLNTQNIHRILFASHGNRFICFNQLFHRKSRKIANPSSTNSSDDAMPRSNSVGSEVKSDNSFNYSKPSLKDFKSQSYPKTKTFSPKLNQVCCFRKIVAKISDFFVLSNDLLEWTRLNDDCEQFSAELRFYTSFQLGYSIPKYRYVNNVRAESCVYLLAHVCIYSINNNFERENQLFSLEFVLSCVF